MMILQKHCLTKCKTAREEFRGGVPIRNDVPILPTRCAVSQIMFEKPESRITAEFPYYVERPVFRDYAPTTP